MNRRVFGGMLGGLFATFASVCCSGPLKSKRENMRVDELNTASGICMYILSANLMYPEQLCEEVPIFWI